MVFNSIKVFARVKQEKTTSEKLYDISNGSLDEISFFTSEHTNYINTPRFRFHKVFDQDVNQNDIFLTVAKPVINSVLQGFNGTIFAYGQTGSGKTFSITGSPKTYQDRGIIPRTIQDIFNNIEKEDEKPIIYISYMEIYNEICYDLLHTKQSKTAIRLEELPRVVVLEDKNGDPRLRNLSVIPVTTEQEAMRLLFLGDTNRTIAETPMNEYSSRSHCIFTIYLTYRAEGFKTRFSKLNLVDLAGSERVYKSQITGSILNEAKHINLSLHFLQQVILALSESRRVHIPYRNSVMTFILKDSLAGNCITVMLATLAVNHINLQESISTCKFAQRVSMIKTEPTINELNDPQREIEMLKNEVQALQKQLTKQAMKDFSKNGTEDLTDFQKSKCKEEVDNFLYGSNGTQLNIEPNFSQIQYCFRLVKDRLIAKELLVAELRKNSYYGEHDISTDEFKNTFCSNLLEKTYKQEGIMEESSYYTTELNKAYENAKILANTIDECQRNILYIKKKLDKIHKKDFYQRILLSKELDYQQNIYKKSIIELKDIKTETLHLESKLQKCNLLAKHGILTAEHVHEYQPGSLSRINSCCRDKPKKYNTNKNEFSNKALVDPVYKYEKIEARNLHNDCSLKLANYQTNSCNCGDYHCHGRQNICQCESAIQNYNKYNVNQTPVCNCGDCRRINICPNQKLSPSELQHIPDKLTRDEHFSVIPTMTEHRVTSSYFQNTDWESKPCSILQNQLNGLAGDSSDNEYINFPPYRNLEIYSNDGDKNIDRSDPIERIIGSENVEEKTKANHMAVSDGQNLNFVNHRSKSFTNGESVCSLNVTETNLPPKQVVNELTTNNYTGEDYGDSDICSRLFKVTDTNDFKAFMKTIPLTGDFIIDQEICEFYREKFG